MADDNTNQQEKKVERIPHVYVPVASNPTRLLREFCEHLTRAENNGLTCVTLDLREREAIFVTTAQHLESLYNKMQTSQSAIQNENKAEQTKSYTISDAKDVNSVRETIVYPASDK